MEIYNNLVNSLRLKIKFNNNSKINNYNLHNFNNKILIKNTIVLIAHLIYKIIAIIIVIIKINRMEISMLKVFS